MPITQNTYTVPNNFVQQYDLGQKKIRADLVDENFIDAAGAINTLLTDDANTVHLTGAETISGAKTFTAAITASGGVTGNVSTATALQTARTINGVSFDGTANITVADSTKVALDGSNLSGATVKAVVETWHSGTEWYRVWSDGWIEQGGYATPPGTGQYTVNLNKVFSDTNYTVVLGQVFNSHATAVIDVIANSKTTSNFKISGYQTITDMWYACGY